MAIEKIIGRMNLYMPAGQSAVSLFLHQLGNITLASCCIGGSVTFLKMLTSK